MLSCSSKIQSAVSLNNSNFKFLWAALLGLEMENLWILVLQRSYWNYPGHMEKGKYQAEMLRWSGRVGGMDWEI